MPMYRIFRLKDSQRQHFRAAPHTAGLTMVKPKDYQDAGGAEGATPYAAWADLRGSGQPLEVGDLLEAPGGELSICKFVGFEQARWVEPETAAVSPAGSPMEATAARPPAS